jgi:hypothetical protein
MPVESDTGLNASCTVHSSTSICKGGGGYDRDMLARGGEKKLEYSAGPVVGGGEAGS